MQSVLFLSKRKIRAQKMRSVILIVVIALITSTVCSAFSMCETFASYFLRQPAVADVPASDLIANGFSHYAKLIIYVYKTGGGPDNGSSSLPGIGSAIVGIFKLIYDEPIAPPDSSESESETEKLPESSELFTIRASAENAAASIVLTAAVTVLSAYLCLSILFAVTRKRNRKFYASLLLSGASATYVRRCERLECALFGAVGVPCGLLLSCAQIALLRAALHAAWTKCAAAYTLGGDLPWSVHITCRAVLLTLAVIALLLLPLSGRDSRRLFTNKAFAQLRTDIGALYGVSVLSYEAHTYKRIGAGRLIGRRLFSENILSYLRIFLLGMFTVSVGGVSLVAATIVRNFNYALFAANAVLRQGLVCTQLFFFAVTAVLFLTSLIGAAGAVLSTVDKNLQVYAQIRSFGASRRAARLAVRSETALCMLLTALLSSFLTSFFALFFLGMYMEEQTSLQGGGFIPWIVGGQIAALLIAMRIAMHSAIRRADRMDVIAILKGGA